MEKDKYRQSVLEKIEEYEQNGWFDRDVEDDPPYEPLQPGDVDYFKKKLSSKIKTKYCNFLLNRFIKKQLKAKQGFLKEITGLEKLQGLENSGAIVTANHFHPYDSFPIRRVIKQFNKKKTLHTIIKEGNYAGVPGFFGFVFRNQNTIPLAQNRKMMMDCFRAVDYFLKKGDWVLIYPEQSMWWNYKKPRPLKEGAYKFAVRSNVPVIAIFTTLSDTEYIGADGYPIQEYTLHILDVIYPQEGKSADENMAYMKQRNEELTKNKYEEVYGVPLQYTSQSE